MKGDNDPIDAIDISDVLSHPGHVKVCRVLGAIGLLDEGETDWKIIVVDVNDSNADKLHDIDDVKREMPGLVEATIQWLRNYKIPDGKGPNAFALDGKAMDKSFALAVIEETHEQWKQLIHNKIPCKTEEYNLST